MIIVKNAQILYFEKNAYICNTEKTNKITVMKEKSNIKKQRNYRITIILKDG